MERASGAAPELLRVALGAEHPNDVARRLAYLAAISRAGADAIDAHRAALAELDRVRSRLEERSREIPRLEARAREERERLLAERRERRRVLGRIGEGLRSSRAQLRALLAEERKIARILAEADRFASERASPVAGTAFSSLRGKLVRPVRELVARIAAGASRFPARKGVFLPAREGEPVRSVAAGQVVYADWMRGFGNLLIVDHGEAYFSIYGNNEALLKQPGDAVAAGEAVALVGASGGGEESGLYFELRHLGRSFDPMPWLPRQ